MSLRLRTSSASAALAKTPWSKYPGNWGWICVLSQSNQDTLEQLLRVLG
jgi:hypothetical protein